MALPSRLMHVPAGLPIDEVTRSELLDVGRANRSNINVRNAERMALEKRLGFGSLVTTRLGSDPRTAGRRILEHKGVPTIIDGTHLDSYVEVATQSATRSRVSEVVYRLLDCPAFAGNAKLADVEYCNGYIAVAYLSAGPLTHVAILEASTGAVVRAPEAVSSGYEVSLASFSSRYIVLFSGDSRSTSTTGDLRAYIFDTQTPANTWTSLATVATGATGAFHASCSLSNRVAVVYCTGSGTNRLTVKTYNASGLLETTTVGTSSVTPDTIDVNGSIAGTLWVAWNETTSIKACGLDADSLATVFASTATIMTTNGSTPVNVRIVESSTAGKARMLITDPFGTMPRIEMRGVQTSGSAAAVDGVQTRLYHVVHVTRPFQQGGRYYVGVIGGVTDNATPKNTQAMFTVVDWTDNVTYLRPVANIEPGLVDIFTKVTDEQYRNRKFSVISSTKWVAGIQTTKAGPDLLASATADYRNGCVLVELDFGSRANWQSASHANYTFLGGGLLSVYDGERVTEAGILVRPLKPTTSLGGTGITGSYRYVCVYEDVDASGNWTVSGVSTPSDVASPSNQTVTISTSALNISARIAKGSTRVVFYRTANGGEPPYYRLNWKVNDTSLDLITLTDAIGDATLTQRPKLYAPNLPGTAGEAQDRRAPPGLNSPVSYSGMLVAAKGDSLFFSGQDVYGEATWFSPAFQVPVSGGGDIVSLRAQDGALFIFKRDRVFAVAGEAPSDNGLVGGFGTPRLIASDVGCIEPNSVVVTSLGIFFQSDRGIEVLTRAQTVEYIGEPVQTTLASFPVVTSAVLDERNALVRFALAASESGGVVSGNGRDLIFDLTTKSWISVDDKRGSSASQPSQSAALVYLDGKWRYTWLASDGVVYYERDEDDASAYLDGSSWVTAQYELPPWKLNLQGEQRIYETEFLFERHSAAGLTIEAANDYSESYTTSKVWAEGALSASTRQVSFRTKPLSVAVQLRVKDTAPAVLGNGRGLTFIGLSSDVAEKRGTTRGTTRITPELRR